MSSTMIKVKKIFREIPLIRYIFCKLIDFQTKQTVYRLNKETKDNNILNFGDFDIPTLESPTTQLCTYEQMTSETYKSWCQELKTCARLARKHWEYIYLAEVLRSNGMLNKTKKGLGFGCGREPLPGLFAKYGCQVTATDLEQKEAITAGWTNSNEHSNSLNEIFLEAKLFIDEAVFKGRVSFENVNMNEIPSQLENQFDFIWSACAFEHLGSLEHGLSFVKESLKCLKIGGIAVHTTEFNLSSNNETYESAGLSVYRKKDIKLLFSQLTRDGYEVSPINLNTGKSGADNYIDLPPYKTSPHMKLKLENYTITSIGFFIKKVK